MSFALERCVDAGCCPFSEKSPGVGVLEGISPTKQAKKETMLMLMPDEDAEYPIQ
jgi:hypothetical protein